MSDDRLRDAITRATQAQGLLGDETLQGAFRALDEAYSAAWRTTTIDQVAEREKLFLAINVVGKVRDHLTSIINNGKLAQAELNELIAVAERKKRFGIL